MHRLFPGNRRLAEAWSWCDSPNMEQRLISLLLLADNTKLLPGAVFFTIPEGATDDEGWRALVGKSVPYCNCASRRVLWPVRGRTRLVTRRPVDTVRVVHDRNFADPNNTRYSAMPLVIAPHGGDLASAYALFSFCSWTTGPIIDQLPFMNDRRVRERLVYNSAGKDYARPDTWQPDRLRFEWLVNDCGELVFYYAYQQNEMRRRWQPLCSAVEVVGIPGEELWDRSTAITFEIDAAVQVLPYEQSELHVCVGDATPPLF